MAEIAVRGVRKSYGRSEILHGIDLTVADGAFAVILGPSGCGKSTLLRMIAGLEEISGGEIAIGGRVVNSLPPKARGCAMVFQNYALYPHMTVAENIGYGLKVAGVARGERRRRVEEVAKALEIGELLDRRPAQLSGGQRQRVAIGRAMIREPEVFLFDEPLSNLDAKLRVQMRVEIRRLHRRLRTTSVFVTHDQVEAMTLADQLIVLNRGHVEQVGPPAEVYARPASRFVADFVGSPPMNLLDARADGNAVVLADGSRLLLTGEVPLPRASPLTLGFRPEAAALGSPETQGALPFDIDFAENLGAGQLLHGRLGGSDVIVAEPMRQGHRSGDRAHARLAPADLHLFAADGLRLVL